MPRFTSFKRSQRFSGFFCLAWFIALGVMTASPAELPAQRYRVLPGPNQPRRPRTLPQKSATKNDSKTTVSVELVADRMGVGFQAQRWQPVFREMGVTVRIRTGGPNDKAEIKEDQVGMFRRVKVIGLLDRRGRIVLPDRTFSQNQSDQLKKYLDDLKKFGKQGNPAGKPLWGLNAKQFEALYKAFSEKVDKSGKGLSLEKAIEVLDLPEEYPLRMSAKAENWLKSEFPKDPEFRQSLEGFSRGTALALLLNEYGLGFQPTRTPGGKIEITVLPIQESTKVWPVGWKLKNSRQKTAPSLFQLVPIDLDDVALLDVLNAVSVKSKVPIRYDHYRIEANDLEMDEMRVNYPPRQTSFSLLLGRITNPHLLAHDLKIDELGQPFLWIRPLRLGKLGR